MIDDYKPFRDATCLLIEGQGHYAQPAASGETGLSLLKRNKYDAVFLALKLESGDGVQILERIRKEHVKVPVVVFGVESTIEMAVDAMRHGAADFLQNPCV